MPQATPPVEPERPLLMKQKPPLKLYQHPLAGLNDAAGAPEIRTPKRGDGRAAQVWDAGGYWDLGAFPARGAARNAARAFIADPARFPAAARYKRRSDGHQSRYKWVRRVKGPNTWQARPWLGAGRGSLNLGLFTGADHGEHAERAAALVARAFGRLWVPGRTVGEAVELLKKSPKKDERCRPGLVVPPHQAGLLPPEGNGPTEYASERRERIAADRYRGALFAA